MNAFLAWLTQLADDGLGGVLAILLPLGVLVFLGACAALVWAVRSQQFDNLDLEARRILFEEDDAFPRRASPGLREHVNTPQEAHPQAQDTRHVRR